MKGCDAVRRFIQRIKQSITRDFHQLMSEDPASSKVVLLKWFAIGFLAFLFVLFLFLQVSLTPKREVNPETSISETDESFGSEEETEVVEEESMFDFEEEEMPELSAEDEFLLKDQIWNALMGQDYQRAADLAYEAVHSHSLSEDSDFLNWYQDIYTVANVKNIETSKQDAILTSFKSPRFQAVFPPFTSVLTLATIVDDQDSLLPIDVRTAQVLVEEWVDPSECANISPYMDQMLVHFKEIYKATISFNGEVVTAYVGIFNNGYLKLLGYYGDSEVFKTDAYWESRRLEYANNPNF